MWALQGLMAFDDSGRRSALVRATARRRGGCGAMGCDEARGTGGRALMEASTLSSNPRSHAHRAQLTEGKPDGSLREPGSCERCRKPLREGCRCGRSPGAETDSPIDTD